MENLDRGEIGIKGIVAVFAPLPYDEEKTYVVLHLAGVPEGVIVIASRSETPPNSLVTFDVLITDGTMKLGNTTYRVGIPTFPNQKTSAS